MSLPEKDKLSVGEQTAIEVEIRKGLIASGMIVPAEKKEVAEGLAGDK